MWVAMLDIEECMPCNFSPTVQCWYSWFHIKGTWIVHLFNGDNLSISELWVCSCGYLFLWNPLTMKYVFLYLNASTIYILERSVFIIIKSLLYFGLVEVKYFSEQGFNLAGIHLHEQLKISVVGFLINRRRCFSSKK